MDPNGSFPREAGSGRNEAYLSPLHEALRGTTAIPRFDAHDSTISPIITPAPQESTTTVLPSHNYASYYPNMAPAHLHPQQNLYPAASHVNTTISESTVVSSTQREQQVFLPRQRSFLTTPVGDYYNPSHQLQIMSTGAPPVTSLLRGDPFAVVHAHLSTTGALDSGPIFQSPAAAPEVNSMASGHPSEHQKPQHFVSSGAMSQQQRSLLGSSSRYAEPFGSGPSERRTFGIFHMPPNVARVPAVGRAVAPERVQREYRCRLCPNSTFASPQAYGGHMSSHSKRDKKNMSAGSFSRAD